MAHRNETERLLHLRQKYRRELYHLKTKLQDLDLDPPPKNVQFNLNIENIDEHGTISQSYLSPEKNVGREASNLECILYKNKWTCRKKK